MRRFIVVSCKAVSVYIDVTSGNYFTINVYCVSAFRTAAFTPKRKWRTHKGTPSIAITFVPCVSKGSTAVELITFSH